MREERGFLQEETPSALSRNCNWSEWENVSLAREESEERKQCQISNGTCSDSCGMCGVREISKRRCEPLGCACVLVILTVSSFNPIFDLLEELLFDTKTVEKGSVKGREGPVVSFRCVHRRKSYGI